jgi:hypothetical protein
MPATASPFSFVPKNSWGNKAQSRRRHRHKIGALSCSCLSRNRASSIMDPFLFLGLTFVAGFAGGYSLRARLSFLRRRR